MNNVVDSSGWLEYFTGTKRAKYFAKAIENIDYLIVSSISIYEVYKKTSQERGEKAALQVVAQMQSATVLDLSAELALAAAKFNRLYRLPMADSIILATARFVNATLWTQDADFEKIPGIKYFRKK